MSLKFSNLGFSYIELKNYSLYLILILFIVLNFLDFFSLFHLITSYPGDLDFFKKLISWSLIYYLFATLSITRIITGFKNSYYDFFLLFAYGLIAIPNLLIFYLKGTNLDYYIFSFMFTDWFLNFLLNNSNLLSIFGILLLVLFSILIFVKLPIHLLSFVGSFELDEEKYFTQIFKFLLVLGFNLFFSLTFFVFFMQWFALAIDAALVVIGFLYYIYYYFFYKKSEINIKDFLLHIVNTGNSFFKQLLTYLQSKNTFFIAISLLLTIHLLVDLGVYIVPFATGIDNPLYNTLGTSNDEIYSIFGISQSIISYQYELFQFQFSNTLSTIEMLIYTIIILTIEIFMGIQHILFYSILLIMPFFVFFTTLQKSLISIPRSIIVFTLMMIIIQAIILMVPQLNSSIQLSAFESGETLGILFESHSFFDLNLIYSTFTILGFAFFIIVFELLLLYLFNKYYHVYKQIFVSSFYISILVFFLFYSAVFAQNYVGEVYDDTIRDNTHFVYDLRFELEEKKYDTYSRIIANGDLLPNSLANLKAGDDLTVESEWYQIRENNFEDSYNLLKISLQFSQDSLIKNYNLDYYSLNSDLDFYVNDYSKLNDEEYLSQTSEIDIIVKFKDTQFTDVIDRNNGVMNSEVLSFLDVKKADSNKIFEIIVSVFMLIIVSFFYLGGIIAYTIFYKHSMEDLKKNLS